MSFRLALIVLARAVLNDGSSTALRCGCIAGASGRSASASEMFALVGLGPNWNLLEGIPFLS